MKFYHSHFCFKGFVLIDSSNQRIFRHWEKGEAPWAEITFLNPACLGFHTIAGLKTTLPHGHYVSAYEKSVIVSAWVHR